MTDSRPLAGKTALVTGAARRLGRAIALDLAAQGANIVLHFQQSKSAAVVTAGEVELCGVKVYLEAADLTCATATERLFARAHAAAGGIDYLVNNASVFSESRLTDFTLSALEKNIKVNAYAPLILMREFVKQVTPNNGTTGAAAIVNLLDTRIEEYDSAHAAYHLSKRMLATLTRMAASEFAPRVRVNAVAPGAVLAPAGESQSYLERLVTDIPLRRTGSPADVARAVRFLLAEPFITGQILYVDGGQHLKGRMYG